MMCSQLNLMLIRWLLSLLLLRLLLQFWLANLLYMRTKKTFLYTDRSRPIFCGLGLGLSTADLGLGLGLKVSVSNYTVSQKTRQLWNDIYSKQEYVLWNAVSVPLLQFARYCSIVKTLSLKYPGRDLDLEVTWGPWSPDHAIRYVQFPIRALSELTEIWSPYMV